MLTTKLLLFQLPYFRNNQNKRFMMITKTVLYCSLAFHNLSVIPCLTQWILQGCFFPLSHLWCAHQTGCQSTTRALNYWVPQACVALPFLQRAAWLHLLAPPQTSIQSPGPSAMAAKPPSSRCTKYWFHAGNIMRQTVVLLHILTPG